MKSKYKWLSSGQKLSVREPGTTGGGFEYLGSLIYTYVNGTLQLESGAFSHGRIMYASNTYTPNYFVKDHLGSVRVVWNGSTVIARNDYYPFGGKWASTGTQASTNRFLYNGKELQTTGGLNYLDYGARMYDSRIGRWGTVDPMANKYNGVSPYTYCLNNPIVFVDPDGNDVRIHYIKNGEKEEFVYNGTQTDIPNNKFVRSFIQAYNYNINNGKKAQNGGGDVSKEVVTNSSIMIDIRESDINSIHYLGSVYWNPNGGLKTDEGNVLSPATVLEHELDHTLSYLKNSKKHLDRANESDSKYENAEERRVITGSEQKTAKANGEIKKGTVTRQNYNGTHVFLRNSISTEIMKDESEQYRKRIDQRMREGTYQD